MFKIFSIDEADYNHMAISVLGIKIKYRKHFDASKAPWWVNFCLKLIDGFEADDYVEKYKKLVKNLDDESVDCINNILSKLELVKKQREGFFCEIFSDEEKLLIKKLEENFQNKILKLSDDCYAYKDYLLPVRRFEPSVLYYKHSIDCLKTLPQIGSKDIMDVGGFIGDSALLFSRLTKGNVYSFEPTNENFELTNKTIKLNDATNIIPVKMALGSEPGEIDIFVEGSGSSIKAETLENPNQKETIQVTTLDKFVEENKLNVGLIKVDIEGFEQEFLKGAINTIKTQKPILLLSIYHSLHDFFEIKPFIESLDLGYTLKIVKPVLGDVICETLLIAEIQK